MEFKDALKQKRKELGLTQTELAKRLGVTFTTVNRLEKGLHQPSEETKKAFLGLTRVEDENASDPRNVSEELSNIIEESIHRANYVINITLIRRNYLMGKAIHEEILKHGKANYGKEIIQNLSNFLTRKYGKGFDSSSLYKYMAFYRMFPKILDSVSPQSLLS